MLHLVTWLVLQRIDNCNSVLINLPTSTISHLYNTFRIPLAILSLVWIAEPTSRQLWKKLHWIAVCHSITFKITNLMHRILHQDSLTYICGLVHFINIDSSESLQSATTRAATTLRTPTKMNHMPTWHVISGSGVFTLLYCTWIKLGDCAFSITGALVWNSLPPSSHSQTHTWNSADTCWNRHLIVNVHVIHHKIQIANNSWNSSRPTRLVYLQEIG